MHLKQKPWSLASTHRDALFGISALSILIFHYALECPQEALPIRLINSVISSVGVEIFVMLSGMGLYYAYRKTPSRKAFYWRRFTRILVPFLLIVIPLCFVKTVLLSEMGFLPAMAAYLKEITFVPFFTRGDRLIWYVPFILAMYLIYPLLHRVICASLKLYWLLVAATLVGVFAVKAVLPMFYAHCGIALWRVLCFEIGVYIGKQSCEGKHITTAEYLIAAAGLLLQVVSALVPLPVRLTHIFYGFFVLIFLMLVLDSISSEKVHRFLAHFGHLSLELYLSHVIFQGCAYAVSLDMSPLPVYLAVIAVSYLYCLVIRRLEPRLLRRLQ